MLVSQSIKTRPKGLWAGLTPRKLRDKGQTYKHIDWPYARKGEVASTK